MFVSLSGGGNLPLTLGGGGGRSELRSPAGCADDASAGNKSPMFQLVTSHFEKCSDCPDILNGLKDHCQILNKFGVNDVRYTEIHTYINTYFMFEFPCITSL